MKVRYLTFTVPPELDGTEVRSVLRRTLRMSGHFMHAVKWLPDGITADGGKVNTRYVLHAGQALSVRLTDPEDSPHPAPAAGALDIVYEDEDLTVVNKAPGVLVHPSHGHFDDTVGNFLIHHYRENGDGAGFHPVHRLDRGTSGLLVMSKHPYGQEKLKGQLHTGDFRRVYLAVCDGVPDPPEGVIDAPIAPVEGSLIAREVSPGGKAARTRYKVISLHSSRALVELELDTGRTHQIRVHMAHIGHPLTGDFLYGAEDTAVISRPALHSARLSLTHPVTGVRLELSCPMPADMVNLLGKEC